MAAMPQTWSTTHCQWSRLSRSRNTTADVTAMSSGAHDFASESSPGFASFRMTNVSWLFAA